MKTVTVRMRVDLRQKKWWMASLKEFGLEKGELSSYCRQAIDRAIAQDFRSLDPKWQKFLKATRPLAKKHLGFYLWDDLKDRMEIYKAVWRNFGQRKGK